jgi:hypothetical protein
MVAGLVSPIMNAGQTPVQSDAGSRTIEPSKRIQT